jgi:TPP-dependent pyruvate/acetoin dehydrogenase alpha subunit
VLALSEGVLDEQEALDIEAKVGSQVDGAISFALEAEYPGVEDALNCTFA